MTNMNYSLLLKDLAKEVREKGTDLGLGEAFAEACLKGAEALEREETTQWYLAEEFNTWECEKCYYQAHISGINFCPNCGRKVEK